MKITWEKKTKKDKKTKKNALLSNLYLLNIEGRKLEELKILDFLIYHKI